jgi:hypothetical protein
MGYTIIRNDNTFTITKTGVNDIYVTVFTQTFCGSNQWEVIIPEQSTDNELTITLPNQDNLYKIFITDKQSVNDYINVSIYKQFLQSFVESVNDLLCGCPCEECNDCDKKDKDYSSTLLKLLAYNTINEAVYNEYLTATNHCIKCSILDANQCILTHETITGNSDNTLLMKQLIAYYYLVFYYTDLKLNNNSSNVTTLYNYNNIIKCVRRLGVDEMCIKNTIITEVHGIYTYEFNNTFM